MDGSLADWEYGGNTGGCTDRPQQWYACSVVGGRRSHLPEAIIGLVFGRRAWISTEAASNLNCVLRILCAGKLPFVV